MNIEDLKSNIFKINNNEMFNDLALEVFRYQYKNIPIYRQFVNLLNIDIENVNSIEKIPFLPIELFKTLDIIEQGHSAAEVFSSSGTTGMTRSKHLVSDVRMYQNSYLMAFEMFYGNISDYTILALLPNYLERDGSSLIYMVDDLIKKSGQSQSGFYLYDFEKLAKTLRDLDSTGNKVLLIGVSFALLDFVEKYSFQLQNTVVMETGGMKGRRKEMLREELHNVLKQGFGLENIHSEYGMTELLSQSYSNGNGIFGSPPWMKIILRDTEDPLNILSGYGSGAINVIDLANLHSCSFIATQDLGKISNCGFEVIGRFDHSDIRGCNLLLL